MVSASSTRRSAFDPAMVQKQDHISQILKDYMNATNCIHRPKPWNSITNQDLEDFMLAEMRKRNINSPQLERTLHVSATFAEMVYHGLSVELKKITAQYTWYLIYVDDVAPRNPTPFVAFQHHFLHNLPQLDPVLDALADVLHLMYDHYDAVFANTIISGTFDYITVTCMEPVVESFTLTPNVARFPWFFRSRTGVAIPYGLFSFPKSRNPDIGVTLQILPTMDFWIAATNDFLSFYKEELAAETATYINNRAKVEGKTPMDVFGQLRFELAEAARSINAVVCESTANMVEAWSEYEFGYIWWHLEGDRYKLKELGL
ncbi:isoprenoid synthase domain-containing protein [Russula dissimulans]|nr:isoprenoid synthase domain-containing protein [Russula dissimulans]